MWRLFSLFDSLPTTKAISQLLHDLLESHKILDHKEQAIELQGM